MLADMRDRALIAERELAAVTEQRDEARELIDDIWITATSDHRFIMPPSKKHIPQHIEGIIKAYDRAHDDWTPKEIKNLMRERDEARKETIRTREFMDHGFAKARDELTTVTEQRDRLAEVMTQILNTTINHTQRKLLLEQALQSLTTKR
jgi:hypothetical protein